MKVLLFAHDPGGANTVFPLYGPLMKKFTHTELWGKGPALAQYQKYNLNGKNLELVIDSNDFQQVTNFIKEINPDIIVTGTSGEDFTEKNLWKAAVELQIPSLAILDHWSNYSVRFSDKKITQVTEHDHLKANLFPTRICVMDEYAKKEMLASGFDSSKIVVTGHPYFQLLLDFKKEKNFAKNHSGTKLITFASEPMSHDWSTYNKSLKIWGYNEYTVLESLIMSLIQLAPEQNTRLQLIVRLHPRDDIAKFDDVIKNVATSPSLEIICDNQTNGWEQIMHSDIVCGMSSMYLIESVLLGKPTIPIQLNLKKKDPFVLSRRQITQTVVDQPTLRQTLDKFLTNKTKMNQFKVITNPIEKVMNVMESLV